MDTRKLVCLSTPLNSDKLTPIRQLTALMGPSGSGKTTLLNVLAHRNPATKVSVAGDIVVNGSPIASNAFRNISSYVEQEDALIGSLTVRETLDFAARLSLPR